RLMGFIPICANLSRFTARAGEHGLFKVTKFDRECRSFEMHPAVEALMGKPSHPAISSSDGGSPRPPGRIGMTSHNLERVALTLVAEGKGILAADETNPTLTRRFDTLGIQSTEQSRRTYREMLFTSPGAAEFISGVIMYDE